LAVCGCPAVNTNPPSAAMFYYGSDERCGSVTFIYLFYERPLVNDNSLAFICFCCVTGDYQQLKLKFIRRQNPANAISDIK
jgi:hypothetical protein